MVGELPWAPSWALVSLRKIYRLTMVPRLQCVQGLTRAPSLVTVSSTLLLCVLECSPCGMGMSPQRPSLTPMGSMGLVLTAGDSLVECEVTSSAGTFRGSWPLCGRGLGYCCSGWSFCLSLSLSQAQWDCVNAKYKQKKRNYKNSGVVVLTDLKVSEPQCCPEPLGG